MIATLLAFLAASSAPPPLPVGYHWGRCLLQVEGKAYIEGRCSYYLEKDGSFMIAGPRQDYAGLRSGKPLAELTSKDHFAQVNVRGSEADGFWNKDIKGMHAQDPLGVLKRQGACWSNATARVCLRKEPS